MAQQAAMATMEAAGPWSLPPLCTCPQVPWCPDRYLRSDAPERVCRAPQPCRPPRAEVKVEAPREWSERDVQRLSKNSHMDLKAIQWLLDEYHPVEEIRVKLAEFGRP